MDGQSHDIIFLLNLVCGARLARPELAGAYMFITTTFCLEVANHGQGYLKSMEITGGMLSERKSVLSSSLLTRLK